MKATMCSIFKDIYNQFCVSIEKKKYLFRVVGFNSILYLFHLFFTEVYII